LRREQSAALYSSSIKASFARLMASMYVAPDARKILASQKEDARG
jgi:hypothetical protein